MLKWECQRVPFFQKEGVQMGTFSVKMDVQKDKGLDTGYACRYNILTCKGDGFALNAFLLIIYTCKYSI